MNPIYEQHSILVKNNSLRYLIKEMTYGFVAVGEYDKFRGNIIYILKSGMGANRKAVMEEMSIVGKSVVCGFGDILSMMGEHSLLYWRSIVSEIDDDTSISPIWWLNLSGIFGDQSLLQDGDLRRIRTIMDEVL